MQALTSLQIAISHRVPLEMFSAWLPEHHQHLVERHEQAEPAVDEPKG